MSGAARLSIHRNGSSRKKTLSCRQKYSPIMIGICANSSRQPPIAANGLTPLRHHQPRLLAVERRAESSLYFFFSFSNCGASFFCTSIIFMFICVCFLLGMNSSSRTMIVSTTMDSAQFGTTEWIDASSQCMRLVNAMTRSVQ